MAVKDESSHHVTESLLLTSPRRYYRSYMHAPHWQLRSLLGATAENTAFYPDGSDIYRLNTTTCERDIVASLPFNPRCLVASNGWICCGADLGDYAAIKVRSDWMNTSAAPDARLNLNSLHRPSSGQARHTTDLSGRAKVTKIGKEIVNCITLWFPNGLSSNDAYQKPVAVLSNNDKSVTIVDLETSEAIDQIYLSDCVNRAVISPDGLILIAIGDDPFVHVYRRGSAVRTSADSSNVDLKHTWNLCDPIQLKGQHYSNRDDDMRGSFTAAFSPSGRYLAVGTQYGTISIFDCQFLVVQDIDPTITTMSTSRPYTKAGAVRAMEFSPEPLDLLVWTEDGGRFSVADVRTSFVARQTIDVDCRSETIQRVGVTERLSDQAIDPRLRSSRTSAIAWESGSSPVQRQGNETQPDALTRTDTEVLEALQSHRRRRQAESERAERAERTERAARATPTTENSSRIVPWEDLAENLRRNTVEERSPGVSSTTLPNSLRDFISPGTSESLRAYITERNQDRDRRGQPPRRRGSFILAAAQTALDRDARERDSYRTLADHLRPATSTSPRTSSDPPRLPPVGSDSPNNPWTEVEALYNIAFDPPSVDRTTRMRIELGEESRRDYARLAQRNWRGQDESTSRVVSSYDSRTGLLRGLRLDSQETQTTGCAWSSDGRSLYIGAENGVYEYRIDMASRKFFPSLQMR